MTRRLIDPKKEALVNSLSAESPKASPSLPLISDDDLSIDEMLKMGLKQVYNLLRCISRDISTGNPERETVMNLRDCMTILHELKKKEQEILDNLSDEDLQRLANTKK